MAPRTTAFQSRPGLFGPFTPGFGAGLSPALVQEMRARFVNDPANKVPRMALPMMGAALARFAVDHGLPLGPAGEFLGGIERAGGGVSSGGFSSAAALLAPVPVAAPVAQTATTGATASTQAATATAEQRRRRRAGAGRAANFLTSSSGLLGSAPVGRKVLLGE